MLRFSKFTGYRLLWGYWHLTDHGKFLVRLGVCQTYWSFCFTRKLALYFLSYLQRPFSLLCFRLLSWFNTVQVIWLWTGLITWSLINLNLLIKSFVGLLIVYIREVSSSKFFRLSFVKSMVMGFKVSKSLHRLSAFTINHSVAFCNSNSCS